MSSLRRYVRARRPLYRRAASAVLLAAYVVTAAGVPLPSGARPQKSHELFPCAASGCGCDSAERCWRSCCCHTLAERLAWARKHGARPPAFAIVQARLAGFDVTWLANDASKHPVTAPTDCCVAVAQRTSPACCQKPLAAAGAKSVRTCCTDLRDKAPATTGAGRVIGWQALKCRGQSPNWLAAVPPLVATQLLLSRELPRVQWLGSISSEHAESASRAPALPPPETA